jgi:hypothetical protein
MTTVAEWSGNDGRSKTGRQLRRKAPHVGHGVSIRIDARDVDARAQEIHEVAAPAAARVEHAVARGDAAAQELVKQINIDRAELSLEIHGRSGRT